jgi:hypothetical protein
MKLLGTTRNAERIRLDTQSDGKIHVHFVENKTFNPFPQIFVLLALQTWNRDMRPQKNLLEQNQFRGEASES